MATQEKNVAEIPHKFSEDVEARLAKIVVDSEFATGKSNQSSMVSDYESYLDMLECIRSEKNYDWMSDVFYPEFASIINTNASMSASQYFQSRDFVEARLDSGDPKAAEKCRAAKNCVNKTLNMREIYHYPKYMRGRLINNLIGVVYAVENWTKERDANGNLVSDHYDYDIVDPANVVTDPSYVYNVQQKQWITFRCERTLDRLRTDAEDMGYFNLDIVESYLTKPEESETSRESFNNDGKEQLAAETPVRTVDILTRMGKMWCKVLSERPDDHFPLSVEPAENGDKDARFIECVVAFAVVGGKSALIRFQPQMCRDPKGRAYRPVLRGLCYIHPRKDSGLSAGKYLREMQIALNDTINMSNDRTKLSTFPTFVTRKYAFDDNDTFYIEPEHNIEVENVNEDIRELKISSDVQSAMQMFGLFKGGMEQIEAVYPTTMGGTGAASTTATAIAGSESRSNMRANYGSLTYEYTYLIDQYTHILWMTYQFAEQETAIKLMGQDAFIFDPDADYNYEPITSNIEAEHSKDKKLQRYEQWLGRLGAFAQNPKIHVLVNHIFSRMFALQGDEPMTYIDKLLDEAPPEPEGGAGPQAKDAKPTPTSNQTGQEMSGMEQSARGIMGNM